MVDERKKLYSRQWSLSVGVSGSMEANLKRYPWLGRGVEQSASCWSLYVIFSRPLVQVRGGADFKCLREFLTYNQAAALRAWLRRESVDLDHLQGLAAKLNSRKVRQIERDWLQNGR